MNCIAWAPLGLSNIARVPPDYTRKQTLVNSERFITEELKVYESSVLTAEVTAPLYLLLWLYLDEEPVEASLATS